MSKAVTTIAVILLIGACSYGVLGYMNYVPLPFVNPINMYPGATEIQYTEEDLAEYIEDPELLAKIQEFEIKAYGINGYTSEDVHNWLLQDYEGKGWSLVEQGSDSGDTWTLYWAAMRKGIMGTVWGVGEGDDVKEHSGYDTVIIVINGPIWKFFEFM